MTEANDDTLLRAQARVGTVLQGKYRLDAVLGLGGMAAVYKATHRNHAEFAIKILHAELSLRADVRQRFLREGYAANSVKHPGVVLVVDDAIAEDGSAFLVMELVQGVDVDALCDSCDGRLPIAAVLSIADQLLDVLQAAHGKGIVHRDIKPANLFVTTSGVLKVLDFGIARARDVAVRGSAATGTGMVLGTPAFMSPEQAMAKSSEIDAQTDVWAAGATMFRMLTGRLVHEADNVQQLMIKTATVPPRSLRSLISDAPEAVVAVVDKALAFDKASRWPSAAEMRDALSAASQDVLGAMPSGSALVPLVKHAHAARTELAEAATAPTERAKPAPDTAPAPSEAQGHGFAPARTPQAAAAAPFGKSDPGVSTATPVSGAGVGATLPSAGKGPRTVVVSAVLVGAAALVVILALRFRSTAGGTPASSVPAGSDSAVSVSSVAFTPSAPVTASAGVLAPLPDMAIQAPSASAFASTRSSPPVVPAAPARPSPRGTPAAPPPAPSAKPKCHMTTWVDDTGETHAKQVCE